jgi:hypothetical protein
MTLVKQLALYLEKGHSVRGVCFVATSGLEKRRACGSFMTVLKKIPSSLGTEYPIDQLEEFYIRSSF